VADGSSEEKTELFSLVTEGRADTEGTKIVLFARDRPREVLVHFVG
jgi:hypothetical protein